MVLILPLRIPRGQRLPPRGPADYFRPVPRIGPLSPFREAKQTATIRIRTNERERTKHEREKSKKKLEEGKIGENDKETR